MVWWLATSPVEVSYEPFAGLHVRVGGVPVVQGSGFQYFEAKSGKGLFSSRWRPQQIESLPDGSLRVRFMDQEGDIAGTHTFERRLDGFTARYLFRWRGKGSAKIENTLGLLWASGLSEGKFSADSGPLLDLGRSGGPQTGARPVTSARSGLDFQAPAFEATVTVRGGTLDLSDARGSTLDWARGKGVFALATRPFTLATGEEAEIRVDWTLAPRPASVPGATPTSGDFRDLPEAYASDPKPLPLLPKPRSWEPTGATVSAESPDFKGAPQAWADWVRTGLSRLWLTGGGGGTAVRARVADIGLPSEGYELRITPSGVEALGQDAAGLRHAAHRLAHLARPSGSRLVWPCGVMRDHPAVSWRGVHLFVGPDAPDFQSKLVNRVLAPLGFNRSVLQCERTAWKSLGREPDAQTMSVAELARLFSLHREAGLEPVPLIQSLGHMGWFFQGGQNLDLAMNPQLPFTLDARRKRARDMIAGVWREAVAALKPSTVHFGLDEISRRGMLDDPPAATRLWNVQVPHLMGLAKELRVKPMMWGDFMLAPGEAVDATNGVSPVEAQARRAFLRTVSGVMVADWHYANDPRPESYRSLALWKSLGAAPVAASWFRPNNIRGHTLAAVREGAGTLQTTWAGTQSDEVSMIRHLEQFTAFVLAADYAWSGRTALPESLDYQPKEVFQRLYFSPPQAVGRRSGKSLTDGSALPTLRVGPAKFWGTTALPLHTPLTESGRNAPRERTWNLGFRASAIAVALDCAAWMKEGDPVAEIEVVLADGSKVRQEVSYGLHVRCHDDGRPALAVPSSGGVAAFVVPLGSADNVVQRVTVRAVDPLAGVRVRGLTAL